MLFSPLSDFGKMSLGEQLPRYKNQHNHCPNAEEKSSQEEENSDRVTW